jgi:6-phosphogluconolactonase (cycloisomerase 2 family)
MPRLAALFAPLLALLLWLPLSSAEASEELLYLSCSDDARIEVYAIGPKGTLTLRSKLELPGGPAPLALSPDGARIYAAIRSGRKKQRSLAIATLRRLPQGKLELESKVEISTRPAYLRVAPNGKFLLAAHYGGGFTTVFKLDQGAFTGKPSDRAHTTRTAHSVEFDPSGRFAFIPHTAPNRIYQYRFDAERGELVPNDPPYAEGPKEELRSQPRHIRFHPKLPLAYTSNERGGGISAWTVSPKGQLKLLQTLSALPKTFEGESAASEIRLSPDGRFAYVANRDKAKSPEGQDTIAAFALDDQGRLSALGHVSTARFPRSFNLASEGRLLYAAGQRDGKLACYRIDDEGRPQEFARLKVGARPSWVLVAPPAKNPPAQNPPTQNPPTQNR